MVVPFGFSVGDFIACASLIKSIHDALRDSGGSEEDFQLIDQDLENLHTVLEALDQLQPDESNRGHVEAVRLMALECQEPLKRFFDAITKKFKPALGTRAAASAAVIRAQKKIQWAMFMQKDVTRFRGILTMKIVTITLLLKFVDSPYRRTLANGEDGGKGFSVLSESEHLNLTENLEGAKEDFKVASAAADESAERLGEMCLSRTGTPQGFGQIARRFSVDAASSPSYIRKPAPTTATRDAGSARSVADQVSQLFENQRDYIRDELLQEFGEVANSLKEEINEELRDLLNKNLKSFISSVELTEARLKIVEYERILRERDEKEGKLATVGLEDDQMNHPAPLSESNGSRPSPSRWHSAISRESTPIYEDISMFPFGEPVPDSLFLQKPALSNGISTQVHGPTTIVLTESKSQVDEAPREAPRPVPVIKTIQVDTPASTPQIVVGQSNGAKAKVDYKAMVVKQQWQRGVQTFPSNTKGISTEGFSESIPQWIFDSQLDDWFVEISVNGKTTRHYEDAVISRATCPIENFLHASGRCSYNPSTGHYWHTSKYRSYFMFVDDQGRMATAWLDDHKTAATSQTKQRPPLERFDPIAPAAGSQAENYPLSERLEPQAPASTRSRSLGDKRQSLNLPLPQTSSRLRSSSSGDLASMATQYLRIDDPQKKELHKMGSSVTLSSRPTYLTGYEVPMTPTVFFVVGRVFNAMMDSKRWCFASPGELLTKHHMKATLLVARSGQGGCLCLRVSTYKGLGTTHPGVNPQTHARIYTQPNGTRILPGEEGMWMQPLFVRCVTPDVQLDPMSRADFGDTHVVSDQIAVREIGLLSGQSASYFLEYLHMGPLLDGVEATQFIYQASEHHGPSLPKLKTEITSNGLFDFSPDSAGIFRRGTVAGAHRAPSQIPESEMARSKSVKSARPAFKNAWLTTLHRVSNPTNFFVVGRVFSCAYDYRLNRWLQERDELGLKSDTIIRHILVVGIIESQSVTCVPINTYNGKGVPLQGSNAADHAMVYMVGKTPTPFPGEPSLGELPLKMMPVSHQTRLHPSSRINYGSCHRLDFFVAVCELGALAESSLLEFTKVVHERRECNSNWWY